MEGEEENNEATNEQTPPDPPSKTEDFVDQKVRNRGINPAPLPTEKEDPEEPQEDPEQGKDQNLKVISDDERPGGEDNEKGGEAPDPEPEIDDNEVEGALKLFDILVGLGLGYMSGDVMSAKKYRADKEDLDDMREDAKEAMKKMGLRVHPYIRTANGIAKAYSHKVISAYKEKGKKRGEEESEEQGEERTRYEERTRDQAEYWKRRYQEEAELRRKQEEEGKTTPGEEEKHLCEWCNGELSDKQVKEGREFCSRKCSAQYRAKHRNEKKRVEKWRKSRNQE